MLRVKGPGFNPRYVRLTFLSRLMFFLLLYRLYLVQYSLLFNFVEWKCVVLIISKCGVVATKQLNWL